MSGGARPKHAARVGLRGENGNQSFSMLLVWWRKPYTFLDAVPPTSSSLERLPVSVALDPPWRGGLLQDSSLAPRSAVATRFGRRRSCLCIGHPTRTTRDRGARDEALPGSPWSGSGSPHCHWLFTQSLRSPMESPVQGQEELEGTRSNLGLRPPHGTSGRVIRFGSICVFTVLAVTHALRCGDPLPRRGWLPHFQRDPLGRGNV